MIFILFSLGYTFENNGIREERGHARTDGEGRKPIYYSRDIEEKIQQSLRFENFFFLVREILI